MDENFLIYSALDAACTLEIWRSLQSDLVEDGFLPAYNLTLDLFPVLMFMQTRGIKVNKIALEETKVEVQAKTNEKQTELDQLCGYPLNINSPKACKEYFYGTLGYNPYRNKEGKETVDDRALQRLARGSAKKPGLRQARLVQEIRGLQKLYSTYLNIEFDEDDRIRCSFNPRGTVFGRLSSSKTIHGTGANFQNLPQAFKKFLVADEGYLMVEVDKRQAEWVVVAYASGDANMLAAIDRGLDVHSHTASLMFNVPVEIVKHENKLIGHTTDVDKIKELRKNDTQLCNLEVQWPRTMSLRQAGKKSNHGLNYAEGFRNFALINEIEESEAKRIVELYHKIYPGIRLWYEHIQKLLRDNRSLTNCFGRKVRFMEEWGEALFKSAYSMIPQSTVVDSLNIGMVKIYNDSELTELFNLDILAQVHDSILMQIPIEVLRNETCFDRLMEKLSSYTSPSMTYNGRTFTIATDAKVGFNWGEFNAETNPLGMTDLHSHKDILQLLNASAVNGKGT